MSSQSPVASGWNRGPCGESLADLARGRTVGRLFGEQVADQPAQDRAGIQPRDAQLAVGLIGLARQHPDAQDAEAVEIVGAIDRRVGADLRVATGLIQRPRRRRPDREAGVNPREIELWRSVDEQDLAGAEPAVRQPQPMGLLQRTGQGADMLDGVGAGPRPGRGPGRGHRGRTAPLQGDVGRVGLQPRIEHADCRVMRQLGRQPDPRDQPLPAHGYDPRAAQLADLDRRRADPVRFRPIRDPVRTGPELGQESVTVKPHRSPRSEPAPTSPTRHRPIRQVHLTRRHAVKISPTPTEADERRTTRGGRRGAGRSEGLEGPAVGPGGSLGLKGDRRPPAAVVDHRVGPPGEAPRLGLDRLLGDDPGRAETPRLRQEDGVEAEPTQDLPGLFSVQPQLPVGVRRRAGRSPGGAADPRRPRRSAIRD